MKITKGHTELNERTKRKKRKALFVKSWFNTLIIGTLTA